MYLQCRHFQIKRDLSHHGLKNGCSLILIYCSILHSYRIIIMTLYIMSANYWSDFIEEWLLLFCYIKYTADTSLLSSTQPSFKSLPQCSHFIKQQAHQSLSWATEIQGFFSTTSETPQTAVPLLTISLNTFMTFGIFVLDWHSMEVKVKLTMVSCQMWVYEFMNWEQQRLHLQHRVYIFEKIHKLLKK